MFFLLLLLLLYLKGVCVANLMALTELMTPKHLTRLIGEFELKEDREVRFRGRGVREEGEGGERQMV